MSALRYTVSCLLLLAAPIATAVADLAAPGPYGAGWTEVTVTRPDNSTFTAVLCYPATSTGAGAAFTAAGAPYPAISFGHGFLQSVERYESTLRHLATHGYLVIASRSQSGLFPSHAAFAADLRHCLTWLEQQHANPAAMLYGHVRLDAFGLSGHSMGGGASILAAAADTRVRAVANLAAAETNPSAIAAIASVAAPVALIAGSADSIVPVGSHGQLMYNAAGAPRQLPLIAGGYHCGFMDTSSFGCDSGPLARSEQLAITRRLLTAFFGLYLKGADELWRPVWGPEAAADARVTTQADAGFALQAADAALVVPAGAAATTTLTLTNHGPSERHFELVVDDLGWPAVFAPSPPVPVAAGGTAEVTLTITAPFGNSATRTALVSARPLDDPGTRAWAALSVQRTPTRGDLNCDGMIDTADVDAFVLALVSPAEHAAAFPDCPAAHADCNGDGAVDTADIDAFVALIVGV
jgi:predicted dienelactone hydrolase